MSLDIPKICASFVPLLDREVPNTDGIPAYRRLGLFFNEIVSKEK